MGTESAKAQSGGIRWKDGVVGMQTKERQGQDVPLEGAAGVFRSWGWGLEGAQWHCSVGSAKWTEGRQAGARRPDRRLSDAPGKQHES